VFVVGLTLAVVVIALFHRGRIVALDAILLARVRAAQMMRPKPMWKFSGNE
jgi:hypothetical protein